MVAVTIEFTRSTVVNFALIIICCFHILCSSKFLTLPVTPTQEQLHRNNVHQTHLDYEREPQPKQKQNQCLGLDLEGGLDKLLSEEQHKQVIIAMPAKASGSSMKVFMRLCFGTSDLQDNVLKDTSDFILESNFFTHQLELPSVIASHVNNDRALQSLIQHATKETLVVYIHREETSRLVSAIKQVLAHRVCPLPNQSPCTVNETVLINTMRRREYEIGTGQPKILTCGVYDEIRDNASVLPQNLLFVHYKQASKLQVVLAKHYCPERLKLPALVQNMGIAKRKVGVELLMAGSSTSTNTTNSNDIGTNNTVVSLERWLDAKRNLLELAFKTKQTASCQSKTRMMEEALLACPDEALHYLTV